MWIVNHLVVLNITLSIIPRHHVKLIGQWLYYHGSVYIYIYIYSYKKMSILCSMYQILNNDYTLIIQYNNITKLYTASTSTMRLIIIYGKWMHTFLEIIYIHLYIFFRYALSFKECDIHSSSSSSWIWPID